MKKIIFLLVGLALLTGAKESSAQKLKSGDLKVLKGQTILNLQYDYSNMSVGKFDKESDYVADRTADMNKKKPGTGDQWAQA